MDVVKKIEDEAVMAVLKNILASPEFASSPRVSDVLRYIVEETLAGRANGIKAYTIAIDVLHKDGGFDPSSNPLVRVLAGRLRETLAAFYSSPAGLDQPVVIIIPKGTYVPTFSHIDNSISPEFSGNHPKVVATTAVSRTIAVEKFSVFTIEAVSETSVLRSDLVSAGFQMELVDKLSRFKDILVVEVDPDFPTPNASDGQYALSGKIRLSGARIIISTVMRRSDDNAVIWSKTYDETFHSTDALFDIQTSVAAGIASTLGQPYGTIGTRIAAVRSRLGEMDNDHYYALVDFYQFSNNKTSKQFGEVLANLEKATAEVPDFSSAWAALSWMYSYEKQNVNRGIDANKFGVKAISAAYKAVNADPNNAMAYQYLAIAKFHEGDHEGFRKAARISLNLNPNDAEVLSDIGGHFIQLDNSEEGRLMVEKAMSLSPGHPPWYHAPLAFYYYARYETDKAIHHARQYTQEGSLSSYILLTAGLAQGNHLPEARETYQKLLEKRPVFASDYHQILANWRLPNGVAQMITSDLIKSGLKETVVSLDNKRASVTKFPEQSA